MSPCRLTWYGEIHCVCILLIIPRQYHNDIRIKLSVWTANLSEHRLWWRSGYKGQRMKFCWAYWVTVKLLTLNLLVSIWSKFDLRAIYRNQSVNVVLGSALDQMAFCAYSHLFSLYLSIFLSNLIHLLMNFPARQYMYLYFFYHWYWLTFNFHQVTFYADPFIWLDHSIRCEKKSLKKKAHVCALCIKVIWNKCVDCIKCEF